MKTRQSLFAIGSIFIASLSACVTYPDYVSEFRFPVEQGNIQLGEQAFIAMQCIECHTIRDYELPPFEGQMPIEVELGGELFFAKTYADLATSIINPNYQLSERYLEQFPISERRNIRTSPMHNGNQDMKVSELIDLVKFLNSRYSLVPGYDEEFIW